MDIKQVLFQLLINFLIKRLLAAALKNESISDQELAEDLHKPVIRKFKKEKVHSTFIDNTWGADLADIQLINKFNKGFRFLLYFIDISSKYAWVFPLKDKKGTTITSAIQKILEESNHKPNKIWVDKGSKFYSRSMKSWLVKNDKKCIQLVMKENLLLLKDSLVP